MHKIDNHPILEIKKGQKVTFLYEGKKIESEKGFTIAAALHQAGYPVHSHSLRNRERSLECGIGKCGACEMLVDGKIKRICITNVDDVKEVCEIPKNFEPQPVEVELNKAINVYKTTAVIIGAGPGGLAVREELNNYGIDNIVIDNNNHIGGQFLMQTHQFFFFEKKKKFGGMRGFEIAQTLAGEKLDNIFLNSTVWDILEGKRIAVKNLKTDEIYYVETECLVIATGAVPFMPTFENDDLPGVYTAAVIQKMMNTEFTLLGKNILTIGAGNIGYLTSYQLMQAGAKVKAIIEAQGKEGGFPVQANRVRRLGIPILLSKILLKAIPNADHTGIVGAVVADCQNFRPIAGTEQIIEGIDAINICTGLVPDDQLLIKGREIFGRNIWGAGDAIRIGEGTSAVLRGKQVAFEIMQELGVRFDYHHYLNISKEYIDSQQEPIRILETPNMPKDQRAEKPFVIADCLYGFACNPCVFACTHNAISKSSTSTVPIIDYEKCIGCMDCVFQCPGLAIFGYQPKNNKVLLPIEYFAQEGKEVFLVNNNGQKISEGVIEKILIKPNKTNIARVNVTKLYENINLTDIRGFIIKENYPAPVEIKKTTDKVKSEKYVCHCDDVKIEEILEIVGERKFISVDEIKHTTRLGMGACRGKRCIPRLKMELRTYNISLVGEATPRGPLSNQINIGEMYPKNVHEKIIPTTLKRGIRKEKVQALVAGGGIGGSGLFRYMAEAGMKPVLCNFGRGSSWRNIAAGRPNFSLPELSDIANNNLQIFKDLQKIKNIDFLPIDYVTFAHDDETYKALEMSMQWSDAEMITPQEYTKRISSKFNPNLKKYKAALITHNCWQATPGRVVDLIRQLGIEKGGTVLEDCKIIDVSKNDNIYKVLVQTHEKDYIEYETPLFVNALGAEADTFAKKLGIQTGLFPVKHQAFITRRLPMLGINGAPLPMIIDRQKYKGFSAVYGQQLAETGQIIGCASPLVEPNESHKNLKINSKEFIEIASEVFVDWIPELSSVGFQAVWAGYYVEPRMIIDTELGLFVGLRGQGFMLSQYLAKVFVDKLQGKNIPQYFERLSLKGDGLLEKAFK